MTTKVHTKPKRRQYYIDKKFQTNFMIKFCLVILVGGFLSVALTMWTSQGTLTSTFNGSELVIEDTSYAIMPSVIVTNIVTTAIISCVAVFVMLFVSHKIAGPIFRFESDLKIVASGDLKNKIRLRNGDQFSGLVGNLNEMVESLNGKVTEIHNDLDRIAKKAEGEKLPQSFIDELVACQEKIDSEFKL